MQNQLETLSDESLDGVTGGAVNVSITFPTLFEVIDTSIGAVGGVLCAATEAVGAGVNSLLGLFGFDVKVV